MHKKWLAHLDFITHFPLISVDIQACPLVVLRLLNHFLRHILGLRLGPYLSPLSPIDAN